MPSHKSESKKRQLISFLKRKFSKNKQNPLLEDSQAPNKRQKITSEISHGQNKQSKVTSIESPKIEVPSLTLNSALKFPYKLSTVSGKENEFAAKPLTILSVLKAENSINIDSKAKPLTILSVLKAENNATKKKDADIKFQEAIDSKIGANKLPLTDCTRAKAAARDLKKVELDIGVLNWQTHKSMALNNKTLDNMEQFRDLYFINNPFSEQGLTSISEETQMPPSDHTKFFSFSSETPKNSPVKPRKESNNEQKTSSRTLIF